MKSIYLEISNAEMEIEISIFNNSTVTATFATQSTISIDIHRIAMKVKNQIEQQ